MDTQDEFDAWHMKKRIDEWKAVKGKRYFRLRILARLCWKTHILRFMSRIIWRSQVGVCDFCGKKVNPKNWHADHLVPLSKGGNHTHRNLAVTHPKCNMSRGNGRISAQLRLFGV